MDFPILRLKLYGISFNSLENAKEQMTWFADSKQYWCLICNSGFEKLGIPGNEVFVESDNQICRIALAKLDFKHDGFMSDCEMKNGKFISIDMYAKLKK